MIKTFTALSDPIRLNIMQLLQAGPRSVGEIVVRLELHQPQVSKHLHVLVEAGLVEVQRDAQRRIYRIRSQPLQELDSWLKSFRKNWEDRYDRLDEYLSQRQVIQSDSPSSSTDE